MHKKVDNMYITAFVDIATFSLQYIFFKDTNYLCL